MKILYIEDNQPLAFLVCTLLKKHGYQVEHFLLGQLGMEHFNQNLQSWDAVIIDLNLPDVDGQTLIPEIAAKRPGIPIIVWSGSSAVSDRFEIFGSGATAVFPKPTAGQEVLDVLAYLVQPPPASTS